MRFVSALLVPAAFWLAGLSPVIAQQANGPAPLSLKECLDIAVKNQIDIQVGKNNLDQAKSASTQAKSDYYPQVTLEDNAFVVGSRGIITQRNTGAAVVATQNIYDGGLREARVAGARYGVTGSKASLTRTYQSVAFDVTKAYYETLRAKHLADVADANVKYNEALKDVIYSRVKLGDAAKSDALPVEAQLANAQVTLLAAQNAVQVAAVQLQNTMGLSPQVGFDVQDTTAEPSPKIGPLDTYVATAIKVRPDIVQAQATVGLANESVKTNRIALYPRPQISADYQKGFGRLNGQSAEIIGAVVFNVFDGGSNRAAYNESVAGKRTAVDRSLQLVKDIQAQVQAAYLNMNNARERLSASQVGYDAAQKNYDVQQARYKQGLAITLDMLNAEVQVVVAQVNEVQARYDFYIAIAQMDFAVGKEGGFNAG